MHTAILSEATRYWDEYIEDTCTQLNAIVSGSELLDKDKT